MSPFGARLHMRYRLGHSGPAAWKNIALPMLRGRLRKAFILHNAGLSDGILCHKISRLPPAKKWGFKVARPTWGGAEALSTAKEAQEQRCQGGVWRGARRQQSPAGPDGPLQSGGRSGGFERPLPPCQPCGGGGGGGAAAAGGTGPPWMRQGGGRSSGGADPRRDPLPLRVAQPNPRIERRVKGCGRAGCPGTRVGRRRRLKGPGAAPRSVARGQARPGAGLP